MTAVKRSVTIALVVALFAGAFAIAKPAKAQSVAPTNLGDLIVLNGLFNSPYGGYGWGGYYGNNLMGLAGLIAVNNVTNPAISGGTAGNSLGDLIVLNGLFSNPYGYGYGYGGYYGNMAGLAGLIAVNNVTATPY